MVFTRHVEGGSVKQQNIECARAVLNLCEKLGALKFGEFELTSGKTSDYYFDGRLVTLDPQGASAVAEAFMPLIVDSRAEVVAGPALAAIPIITAIGMRSLMEGNPVPGLIVRSESKTHGAKKMIEGTVRPGSKVAVVDDTCSTGGSLIHAIDAIERVGSDVVKVICILDRNMGGSSEIRKRGYDFHSLLVASGEGKKTKIHASGDTGD